MAKNLLERLSEKKNFFFLILCLCVHSFNSLLFLKLMILPLAFLNCMSAAFYVSVLVMFKKKSDLLLIFTYFEIILFSFLSELISAGKFGYIYFVLGMIAVAFYLLPSKKIKMHFYQMTGVLIAFGIFYISSREFSLFPFLLSKITKYQVPVSCMNLIITLTTLVIISNLYFVELNATKEKLSYTSNHDMLTGLYNRRFFENVMKRNKAENENCFSIAMFDVDNFKHINDTYGHKAGDLVLESLSSCLSENSPQGSIVVRWGGEEFILYLPQTDAEKALSILQKITASINSKTIEYEHHKIKITTTVGVCTGSDIGDYEKIIKEADEKLYWGKKNGKNRIVTSEFYSTDKSKRIVIYFSHAGENYGVGNVEKGSTQLVAEYIAESTWSDIFRIVEKDSYPSNFDECQMRAKEEEAKGARPEISGNLPDLSEYGTIFIGYPNWWGNVPMCVYTFLENFDLHNKLILPFCTHEGNGFDRTEENLKKNLPSCKFREGFEMTGTQIQASPQKMKKSIDKWISSNMKI